MFKVPQLPYLELQEQLENAVRPLAEQFGVNRQRAWEFLSQQSTTPNSSLREMLMLDGMEDSKIRYKVNQWWKANKSNLPAFGLGIFQKVSNASRLPDPTRRQIVCLVWLTGVFQAEQRAGERKRRMEVVEPQLTLWQRFANWFVNRFSRLFSR